ncbi:hypothetical protein [Levilactobacillus fujinensis]|uniref:Uncharacterized protein n=1 Tax=Levilactobacillus fujinensis TaxID=2486024 RepID=A0ABW1TI04_9LACO|nr:hypothetical protein [Levilactobacillus fujinensis]
MKNANLGLTDDKLHCSECGDVVFKKVSGEATLECMGCGHHVDELQKLIH